MKNVSAVSAAQDIPTKTYVDSLGGGGGGLTTEQSNLLASGSRFGSAMPFSQSVGRFFDNSPIGHGGGTLAGVANRAELAPMYVPKSVTVDRVGIAISSATASSLVRCAVYGADATTFRPSSLVYQTTDLSGAATGSALATTTLTLEGGRWYWVGTLHSSTCTLRTIPIVNSYPLGLTSDVGVGTATVIRKTITFASGWPATWTWADADLTAGITPPSVRFRVLSIP